MFSATSARFLKKKVLNGKTELKGSFTAKGQGLYETAFLNSSQGRGKSVVLLFVCREGTLACKLSVGSRN